MADRIPDSEAAPVRRPVDVTPLIGTWRNTNRRSIGITRVVMSLRDGEVRMRVLAADPRAGRPHDWGEVSVDEVFADGPLSNRVGGYTATYDLGHARTWIQANLSHGLTVLAAFTTFTDGSGRLGYLSREFYHRLG